MVETETVLLFLATGFSGGNEAVGVWGGSNSLGVCRNDDSSIFYIFILKSIYVSVLMVVNSSGCIGVR